jgi:predicted Zn finger-like uncharacterized protein
MKANCPACGAQYPIPDDKVQGKPRGLPVRCKQCGTVFRVFADGRPTAVDAPAAPPPPPAPPVERPRPIEAAPPPPPPPPPPPVEPPLEPATVAPPAIDELEPTAREANKRRRVMRSTVIETRELPTPPPPPEEPVADDSPLSLKSLLAESREDESPSLKSLLKGHAPPRRKRRKKRRRLEPDDLSFTDEGALPEVQAIESIPGVKGDDIYPEAPEPESPPPAAEPGWLEEFTHPPPDETPETVDDDFPFKTRTARKSKKRKIKPPREEAAFTAKSLLKDAAADELPPLDPIGGMNRPLKTALIVGLALVVVAMIVVVFAVRRQFQEIQGNVAKRNEASQIQQEQNRQRLDYFYKYQSAMQAAEPGGASDYRTALQTVDQALAVKPDFYRGVAMKSYLLSLLAIEHAQADGVAEACKLAETVMQQTPKEAFAHQALAACLLASDKAADAESEAHAALIAKEDDEADDAEVNLLLAMIYVKKQERAKALDTLKTVVALNPLHFRGWHWLADLYASQKEWPLALEAEEKALKLQPDHRDAKRRIELYQSQLRGDLAATGPVPGLPAEVGSDVDKKTKAKELTARIDQAMRRGSYNEALGLINELMKLGVGVGDAHLRRCQIMLNMNRYDAAIEACNTARNHSAEAYYYLGAAYEASGNDAMAKQNYQAYLSARPTGRRADEVRSILGIKQE